MRLLIFLGFIFLISSSTRSELPSFIKKELISLRSVPASLTYGIGIKVIGLFITPADMAKMAVKFIISKQIPFKSWFSCGPLAITSRGLVDYGCEAAWAGVFKGIKRIPHELMKYACAEYVYYKLCAGAAQVGIDYPQCIKKSWSRYLTLYLPVSFVFPYVARWAVGFGIDKAVDAALLKKEEQELQEFGSEAEFLRREQIIYS